MCDAQWLLGGHRPSVFRGDWYALYKRAPSCYFGATTARLTVEMKRRLGFPKDAQTPRFGRDLYEILTGRRARPIGYVVRAARVRAAALEDARRRAQANTYAAKVVRVAGAELARNVYERPDGSNYDCDWPYAPCRIAAYQSVTGAYRAPWCASFTQWVYRQAGMGTFANRSAGVFYIVGYARSRGWLRTAPKPGYLVAFVDRLGHIGLVERVVPGGIYSIEGNASNRVLRRYHPLANERPKVYIAIPGLDRHLP